MSKCSHPRTRGVYGDEINTAQYRIRCIDCLKYLDRDVNTATIEYFDWLMRCAGDHTQCCKLHGLHVNPHRRCVLR